MAQWETFGIQMVVRGASNFARDVAHMAMGLATFQNDLNRFTRSVEKSANQQVVYWSRIVSTTQKSINRLTITYADLASKFQKAQATLANETRLANPATNPRGTANSFARHAQAAKDAASDVKRYADSILKIQDQLKEKTDLNADASTHLQFAYGKLSEVQRELKTSFTGTNAALQMILSKFGLSQSSVIKFAESMGMNIPQGRAFVAVLNGLALGLNTFAFAVKVAMGVLKLFWNLLSGGLNIVKNVVFGIGKLGLTILSIPFRIAWAGFTSIWESLKRIAEIAIGMNISNLLWNIGQKLREVGEAAFNAAVDFQLVQIRLRGLIQRELSDTQGISFGSSLAQATKRAQELSVWISKLAVQSIFSAETISDTVTLAMSYDITEEKTKELTLAIVNFSTAMGLSDEKMRRIIENFGQMLAQGKLTGTEIRDLGRGSFVPVNSILEVMGRRLGFVGMKSGELKKKMQDLVAEGTVPVQEFFDAFVEFSNTNFPNAIQSASSSMQVAISNVKDFLDTVIGWRVITPIVDVIGKKLSAFISMFMTDEIRDIAVDIGKGLGIITQALFDMSDKVFGKLDLTSATRKVTNLFSALKKLLGLNVFTPYQRNIRKFGPLLDIVKSLQDFGLPPDVAENITNAIDKVFASIGQGKLDLSPLKPLLLGGLTWLFEEVIKPKFITGWNFIKEKATIIWNDSIKPGLLEIWENHLRPWLKNLWEKDIPDAWNLYAAPEITKLIKKIGPWFADHQKEFTEAGKAIVDGITQFFKDNGTEGSQVVSDIGSVLGSLLSLGVAAAIKVAMGGFTSKIAGEISTTDTTLPDTMKGQLSPVTQAIAELRDTARNALDTSLKEFGEWGSKNVEGWDEFNQTITITGKVFHALGTDAAAVSLAFVTAGADIQIALNIAGEAMRLFALDAGTIFAGVAKTIVLASKGDFQGVADAWSTITTQMDQNAKNFDTNTGKVWEDAMERIRKATENLEKDMVGESIWPDMLSDMSTVTGTELESIEEMFGSFASAIIAKIASIDLYTVAYGVVMRMWQGMNDALAAGGGGGGGGGAYSNYVPTNLSPKKPKVGPLAANGLDMIVPTGYPNDSARVNVSSGERVIVIPSWNPASKYATPMGANVTAATNISNSTSTVYNNSYNLGVTSRTPSSGIIRDFDIMRLRRT